MSERQPIAAFVADIHWMTRTPEYRRETCPFNEVIAKKLAVFADYLYVHHIPGFVAGDTFDISREFVSWWTLTEFFKSDAGLLTNELWAVPGQHDRFHHNPNDLATSLNALVASEVKVALLPDHGVQIVTASASVNVYGAAWGDPIPEAVRVKGRTNILVTHKTLWHRKPVYPGQTEGNVSVEAPKFKALGYDMVFSGDNHKQFDVNIGGVDIHNIGCLTRNDVSYKDQQPRFMVLFDDMSVESVYVGEKDVFELERSDADKGREDKKDEFSEALAGGFEYGSTFKGSLEKIAAEGKCGEATLTGVQRSVLRDIINAI